MCQLRQYYMNLIKPTESLRGRKTVAKPKTPKQRVLVHSTEEISLEELAPMFALLITTCVWLFVLLRSVPD